MQIKMYVCPKSQDAYCGQSKDESCGPWSCGHYGLWTLCCHVDVRKEHIDGDPSAVAARAKVPFFSLPIVLFRSLKKGYSFRSLQTKSH